MKNKFLLLSLIISTLHFSITPMDIAPIANNIPTQLPQLQQLDAILEKISYKKNTNPESYFADKQKIGNSLYVIACLRGFLFPIKSHYDICKENKGAAFYQKKFINGSLIPVLQDKEKLAQDLNLLKKVDNDSIRLQEVDSINEIITPLGTLVSFTPEYGGTEFGLCATTPAQRAFVSKILKWNTDQSNLLSFLKRHFTDPDKQITIMAQNFCYFFSARMIIGNTHSINTFYNLCTNNDNIDYFSHHDLQKTFAKDHILARMAIQAFSTAGEAYPSTIKNMKPLCESPIWSHLENENPIMKAYFQKFISDFEKELYVYSKQNIAKFSKLITTYLTISPTLYAPSLGTMKGDLPFVSREIPAAFYNNARVSNNNSPQRKKRSRGAQQRKKQIQQTTTPVETTKTTLLAPTPATQTSATSQHNSIHENLIIETPKIVYDNRVLEQNANKKDRCHGFTLMAVPHIIKNGTHSTWTNKTTNHKDDHVIMYGEIEYNHNDGSTTTDTVKFEVCTGADNAIYHIGMRKNNDDSTASQKDIQFPPLGTLVTTHKNCSADDYGSSLVSETDYMIQLWDGGLNATITLYK